LSKLLQQGTFITLTSTSTTMVNTPVTSNDHRPSSGNESVDATPKIKAPLLGASLSDCKERTSTKVTALSSSSSSPPSTHPHGALDGIAADDDDDVTGLKPNDILLGRGSGPNQSAGNTIFRNLVWNTFKEYLSEQQKETTGVDTIIEDDDEAVFRPLDATTKNQIARRILDTIHTSNGRFLRRLNSLEAQRMVKRDATLGEENFMHVEISTKEAIEKIKQSLRFQIDQRQKFRSMSNQKRPAEDLHDDDNVPPAKRAQTSAEPFIPGSTGLRIRDVNDFLVPPPSALSNNLLSGLSRTSVIDYAIISALQDRRLSVGPPLLGQASPSSHRQLLSRGLPPPTDVLGEASVATSSLQRQELQQLASLSATSSVYSSGSYFNSAPWYNKLDAITELILREKAKLASINAASNELAMRIRQNHLQRMYHQGGQEGLAIGRSPQPLSALTPASTIAASNFIADQFGTSSIFRGRVIGNGAADPPFPVIGFHPSYSQMNEEHLRKY
jgi:hypothetical protein